jgi:hypothetical protein
MELTKPEVTRVHNLLAKQKVVTLNRVETKTLARLIEKAKRDPQPNAPLQPELPHPFHPLAGQLPSAA